MDIIYVAILIGILVGIFVCMVLFLKLVYFLRVNLGRRSGRAMFAVRKGDYKKLKSILKDKNKDSWINDLLVNPHTNELG